MKTFRITGMSCAACQARVENAVRKVSGVTSCNVNLLTNTMVTEGVAADEAIMDAVRQAGYGAEPAASGDYDENLKSLKTDITPIVKRLIFSAVLTLIIMFFSMGISMENSRTILISGIIQAILSLIVIIFNRHFFINGFRGVFHGNTNMDTLVSLGSGISWLYSLAILISEAVHPSGDKVHFYFESAAMILTLITVGKLLEAISKGRTTDAIRGLLEMTPKTALILSDGMEKTVPIETIKIGDRFIVKAGMSVPADGRVVKGSAIMDESALTGESEPVRKNPGDEVSTATISTSGDLLCVAEKIGQDTTLARIIKTVKDASLKKAPIARIADKAAGFFVPVVMIIALITFIVWMIIGKNAAIVAGSGDSLLSFALSRAVSVLVISCPCSLGLATPVAIMVGTGVASKKGILFKTAEVLEETGKANIIVLDKTGTITTGEVGSDVPKEDSKEGITELKKLGMNVVMLSGDKILRALKIASMVGIQNVVAEVLPTGKGRIVKQIQNPISVYGGEDYLLTPFPEKASSAIRKNKVIMVGDGINDAPALKTAEIGMAIGAGKDIALDAADVVLMNSSLKDVAAAVRMSRRTVLNIKENLFWAFIYNILCIPLAAGVYTGLFGWALNPMIGAAAMALSSFCVVMNALRLNLYDPYREGKEKEIKEDISSLIEMINDENNIAKEKENTMELVLNVNGMMCEHCEARVKEALEKIEGVSKAEPDHNANLVKITADGQVDVEVLKTAVVDCGYKVD